MKHDSDMDQASIGPAANGRGAVDNPRSQMAARRRLEIRELHERGLSTHHIAGLLGVAAKTVRTHLRASGGSRA